MPRSFQVEGCDVEVFPDSAAACDAAAQNIAALVQKVGEARGKLVLGLATGNTPIPVYRRLVAMHREQGLSFAKADTFNLDEYFPIGPLDPNSYHAYMHKHLFAHVDLAPNRAHVLDGTVPEAFAEEHCAAYDRWIEAEGGLDMQLLGLGRNAHIGFNEPSDLSVDEALRLPTRVARLHPVTRVDAARDFGGDASKVPALALTVGVRTILAARLIVVLAFGESKAKAVRDSLRGPITAGVPGSLLRTVAERVVWILDEAAAAGLR